MAVVAQRDHHERNLAQPDVEVRLFEEDHLGDRPVVAYLDHRPGLLGGAAHVTSATHSPQTRRQEGK